ncbi:MAG: DUF4190 domain-containing protein [Lachnospiraceae bacterium]|nr:DUF4190 domain-containing protein [Lachnospiraceae bacterium]
MSKKICPICGYRDEGDAAYCRECGAKMTESQGDAWSAYEQRGQYSSYQENSSQESSGSSGGQYSNYQDYTSKIPYQSTDDYGAESGANGLQIAGLVCGILAICSCCCYGLPAVIFGIAGIICAAMGNRTSKNGIGTAGMVCSVIGLILGVIAVVYYAMVISQLIQMDYMDSIMDMM